MRKGRAGRRAKPAAVRDMSPACTWPSKGRIDGVGRAFLAVSTCQPLEFLLAHNAAEYFFDHAPDLWVVLLYGGCNERHRRNAACGRKRRDLLDRHLGGPLLHHREDVRSGKADFVADLTRCLLGHDDRLGQMFSGRALPLVVVGITLAPKNFYNLIIAFTFTATIVSGDREANFRERSGVSELYLRRSERIAN